MLSSTVTRHKMQTHKDQSMFVVLGEYAGNKVARQLMNNGHKVYVYHPDHNEKVDPYHLNPTSLGMLCLEGGTLENFWKYVKLALGNDLVLEDVIAVTELGQWLLKRSQRFEAYQDLMSAMRDKVSA